RERAYRGQGLDQRQVGAWISAAAVVVLVVAVIRVVLVGAGGGGIAERAVGVNRAGDGDRGVGPRGDAGNAARQRRTGTADAGDRQVARRVAHRHFGRGGRAGVAALYAYPPRFRSREWAYRGQGLDQRQVG